MRVAAGVTVLRTDGQDLVDLNAAATVGVVRKPRHVVAGQERDRVVGRRGVDRRLDREVRRRLRLAPARVARLVDAVRRDEVFRSERTEREKRRRERNHDSYAHTFLP